MNEFPFGSTTIALLLVLLTLIYLYIRHAFTYWKRKGIFHLVPEFPFGNTKNLILGRKSFGVTMYELYKQVEGPYAGFYIGVKPCVLIKDPELLKKLFVKEFNSFSDRGIFFNEKADPLSGHLFALSGEKWRNLRAKVSPTFTSGKMKMMFHTIEAVGNELEDHLDSLANSEETVNMRELFSNFTTDIIGTCVFGIECNSIRNPNHEFRQIGKKLMQSFITNNVLLVLGFLIPDVLKLLKTRIINKECSDYFLKVLEETVKYREENDVHRKDFMDLFIRLKNNEDITDEALTIDSKFKKGSSNEGITFLQLAAQAFLFFFAGFETSATTSAVCLVELAKNMEIQDKLRKEINDVIEKHDNKLTYEAMMEMEYLDKIIYETLRKHPIAAHTFRTCRKKCELTEGLAIEEGTTVWISLLGLHRDPKYYQDPEKFDPERFTEEEKSKRHPYAYLPFGEGPRSCLGDRFAMLQTKMALIAALKKHRFETVEDTKLTWATRGFLLFSTEPILLKTSMTTF